MILAFAAINHKTLIIVLTSYTFFLSFAVCKFAGNKFLNQTLITHE